MKIFRAVILFGCSFFLITVAAGQQQQFVVYFPFNSAEITSTQMHRLDSLLADWPLRLFSMTGHTDSRGSVSYNYALSKRRLDAVEKYFRIRVAEKDIFLTGSVPRGESLPALADEGTEEKGALNRRVEITFAPIPPPVTEEKIKAAPLPVAPPPPARTIKEALEDSRVKTGSTLVFENMNFFGGRHRILPTSMPQLESLYEALSANPKLKIVVEGHICCLPGDADGIDFETRQDDLSYQRARAVAEYLALRGIDRKRVGFRGFGHSKPLYPYPEKTEAEKTANRRVEIRLLEK